MGEFFHILHIEWLKLKYYRTFWILTAMIVVCIPAFNYVIYDITENNFPKMNGISLLGSPFSFPRVWTTVPYNASILIFIPAILIITLLTNEYTYRTHRQNIIDGLSRSQFIFIKLTEVFMLAIFITMITALTCLCFGFMTRTGVYSKTGWQEFRYIFYFFLEMLDYLFIAVIFAILIRRAGLALGIFFLYMIAEQFVVVIGRNKYKLNWVDYLPEEVSDRLVPNLLTRMMQTPANYRLWENHLPWYIAVTFVYIVLYIFIINLCFRKSDL